MRQIGVRIDYSTHRARTSKQKQEKMIYNKTVKIYSKKLEDDGDIRTSRKCKSSRKRSREPIQVNNSTWEGWGGGLLKLSQPTR